MVVSSAVALPLCVVCSFGSGGSTALCFCYVGYVVRMLCDCVTRISGSSTALVLVCRSYVGMVACDDNGA